MRLNNCWEHNYECLKFRPISENCYDHLDDLVTPSCQLEVTDDPLIVPLDISLLPNMAGIPIEGNSRNHLLGSRPKHSILRMPNSERRIDLDAETPDPSEHGDDTSNSSASANGDGYYNIYE